MTRRLRILDPCEENYDAMHGRGAKRFCDKCAKNVHDLTGMTRGEADRFVEERAGAEVCLRYRSDASGQVLFRSAPTRMGFVAAMTIALAGCTGYLSADGLDSPDPDLACYDSQGYAVACDDIAVIPSAEPVVSGPEPEPVPPRPEVTTAEVPEEAPSPSREVEPTLRDKLRTAEAQPRGEAGCPIRPHENVPIQSAPKTARERRRARRQARRADRWQRRHGVRTTMGVLVPTEPCP